MSSIVRRRMIGRKSRLPAGYQEVEWIESHGSEYIDTGYQPTNTHSMNMKLEIISNDTSINGFLKQSSGNGRYSIGWGTNGWQFSPMSNLYRSPAGFPAYGIYTLKWNYQEGIFYYNDNQLNAPYDGTWSSIGNMTINLFRRVKYNQPADYYASYRLYYCIFDDISKSMELIPCLNLYTNKYGLFDLVSNQFFGNQGTGDFTGGSPV